MVVEQKLKHLLKKIQQMMEYYNSLSSKSKIGLSTRIEKIRVKDGPCLPIFIAGSYATKTKTPFKPKIPKSGNSFYKGIYKRSNKGFTYLYDRETSIYIIALHDQIVVDEWIDTNYDLIRSRLEILK